MAMTAPARLAGVAKKRVRIAKYQEFGRLLREWRGDRDVETVVRNVRNRGVDFDGATLRGWEYGWTGRPDPLRLAALADVYGRTSRDVLEALRAARGIKSGVSDNNLHVNETDTDSSATPDIDTSSSISKNRKGGDASGGGAPLSAADAATLERVATTLIELATDIDSIRFGTETPRTARKPDHKVRKISKKSPKGWLTWFSTSATKSSGRVVSRKKRINSGD